MDAVAVPDPPVDADVDPGVRPPSAEKVTSWPGLGWRDPTSIEMKHSAKAQEASSQPADGSRAIVPSDACLGRRPGS
jgi:hypothetical protein